MNYMTDTGDSVKTLNNDFAVLTEENRNRVIEMARFLIITQNAIVPELLRLERKDGGRVIEQ